MSSSWSLAPGIWRGTGCRTAGASASGSPAARTAMEAANLASTLILAPMGSMPFIYLRASSSLTMHTGIRLALGAQPHDVLRVVAVHGLSIALFGIGIGLACAAALTRLLASLLYGVRPSDSLTFAAVPLLLAVVALAASAAPAWRASRVDPPVALRQE